MYELLQELVTASPRPTGHASLIKDTKAQILETHALMLQGVRHRAAMEEAVDDEPVSAVHVGRAARRARQQHIKKVTTDDGEVLTEPAAVQEHFRSLFQAKFQAPAHQGAARGDSQVLASINKVMDSKDNEQLCQPFTAEEVLAAVRRSPKRRSPGSDGITAEFYAKAWDVIGEVLTEVMNAMWSRGEVPAEMTRGIITLVPKKAKPAVAKDWRPITLLDVDYKILARLLTTRLAAFQNRLLHANQVRPGGKRTMAGALCDLRDVLSALGARRVPGCVVSIDFSGAFDNVNHDFMFEVLRRRGVSEHFVTMLQSVYKEATSQLRINGVLTAAFLVARSVRQGCPASMLLFAVVLAPLLQLLEARLQGLAVARRPLRVSAYADDAFLVMRDHAETAAVTDALQDFAAVSGLHANPEKCGALAAGGWCTATAIAFPYVEKLKVLGVTFQASVKAATKDNWTLVLASVRGVLAENATRALGLSQRARYASMYALAKIWHVAQVLPVPKGVADDVVRAVARFLWRGQFFTTTMAIACSPKEDGGLGLPNVRLKCLALFTGRWLAINNKTPDSFSGQWLATLSAAFPQGPRRRPAWPAAWHYNALRDTKATASTATVDGEPSTVIRAIYESLVSATPTPVPRVAQNAPDVQWQHVWANVHYRGLQEDVKDSWWKAVHDLEGRPPGTASTVSAARTRTPATPATTRTHWRTGSPAAAGSLTPGAGPRSPCPSSWAPRPRPAHCCSRASIWKRQAAAVWVVAHTVYTLLGTTEVDIESFKKAIGEAAGRCLNSTRCPTELKSGLLLLQL